jgi:hypothetical protein
MRAIVNIPPVSNETSLGFCQTSPFTVQATRKLYNAWQGPLDGGAFPPLLFFGSDRARETKAAEKRGSPKHLSPSCLRLGRAMPFYAGKSPCIVRC